MKNAFISILLVMLVLQGGCSLLGIQAPITEDEVREFYKAGEFFTENKYWNAYRELYADDVRYVGENGEVTPTEEFLANMEKYFKKASGHQLEYEIEDINIGDGGEQAIVREKSEIFSVFPGAGFVRTIRTYTESEVTLVRQRGDLLVSGIQVQKTVVDVEDK